MKNQIAKIALFGLVATSLAFTPNFSRAQDSTNPPAQTVPKKHKSTPFHGKVGAVDTSAQTVTVGKLVLTISTKTKISNATNGEPAALSDITVGEYISGAYTKDADGNLKARVIHIGKKAGENKKKKSSDEGGSSTNSVAN